VTLRVRRHRRFRLGSVLVTVSLDERRAAWLRRNAVLRRLAGRANGGGPGRSPSLHELPPTNGVGSDTALTPEAAAAHERIRDVEWYHVLDLPHGVRTPGQADHRAEVQDYGLPDDMTDMRALDVATYDGFWAFEIERRGADVTATDIASWSGLDLPLRWREGMPPEQDAPTGAGFRIASELLNSQVERREVNVYDLSPDDIGQFDVVFVSDLLQHLRDPQRALERLYSVTKPGGLLIVAEEYVPALEQFPEMALMEFRSYRQYTWWVPSSSALKLMLNVAGFEAITEASRIGLKFDHAYASSKVILHARR
jgi:tRNA (mo5U34)-methyltransferase